MAYTYKGTNPSGQIREEAAQLHELQTRIADLLRERESLKLTVAALSRQVRALNATPINARRHEAVCGTYSGYQKHLRDKDAPCYPCKAARAEYTRDYRKKQAA